VKIKKSLARRAVARRRDATPGRSSPALPRSPRPPLRRPTPQLWECGVVSPACPGRPAPTPATGAGVLRRLARHPCALVHPRRPAHHGNRSAASTTARRPRAPVAHAEELAALLSPVAGWKMVGGMDKERQGGEGRDKRGGIQGEEIRANGRARFWSISPGACSRAPTSLRNLQAHR